MLRKLRVQYPGAMNHVMSRGHQREDIFLDDVDRAKSNLRQWINGPSEDGSQPKLDI